MIVEITHLIKHLALDNDSGKNGITFESITRGGSSSEFYHKNDYDQAVALENNFEVRDVQVFSQDLQNGNTYSIDVLSFLKNPKTSISFLEVFCIESTDSQKKIPIRFSLSISNDTDTLPFGTLSSFSLNNIRDSKLRTITISDIGIPSDKKGQLFIILGTSERHGTVPIPT